MIRTFARLTTILALATFVCASPGFAQDPATTQQTDQKQQDQQQEKQGEKEKPETAPKKPANSDIENIGTRDINKHSLNFISYEKEIAMGRQMAAEVERE